LRQELPVGNGEGQEKNHLCRIDHPLPGARRNIRARRYRVTGM
jgi:hypothetical protein